MLLEMLNLILTKKLFQIQGPLLPTDRGTAMGTVTAPAYASLVVTHWEEEEI